LKLTLDDGENIVFQCLNNSLPRIFFAEIELNKILSFIEFLEVNFAKEIVYGIICESVERILQNTDKVDSWRRKNRILPNNIILLPTTYYTNEKELEMISIESLPGHLHQMNYDEMLLFSSCWCMYFSEVYYKYIPKPLFDNFKNCFENIILNFGLRKITLYQDPHSFELNENRKKQWSFRKELGIDSIAHELTKSNNRIEPENLPILITKQNCKVGKTRVTRFLNNKNELIDRDHAQIKEVKEYNNDGLDVVFEMTEWINI